MTRLTTLALAAAAVAAAVLALVVIMTGSTATQPQRDRVSLHSGRQAVRVARTKLGPILVNGQGRTLYLFLKDRHGKSTCYGVCARVWPPALTSGAPHRGPGVVAGKLTTTTRKDHTRQLVYNGHPLYAMSADTRPGEMKGQGFLGTWFVVSPAGRRIGEPGASAGGY